MMDQEATKKLVLAIRSGTDLETSCHYAGLAVATVYKNLERGKIEAQRVERGENPSKDEAEYLAFWKDLTSARADAVVRNVAAIQQAASGGSWQAAAWWLERSVPDTYSKTAVERKSEKRAELGG